jgi:hypothetical protein
MQTSESLYAQFRWVDLLWRRSYRKELHRLRKRLHKRLRRRVRNRAKYGSKP